MSVASIVTVCDRYEALERSLHQVVELGDLVLVVDDSRSDGCAQVNKDIAQRYGTVEYLRLPKNRGLACALNIGILYWLADPKIEWISYFQEDVDVDPLLHEVMKAVRHKVDRPLLTGRHAREHKIEGQESICGVRTLKKYSTTGTHLYAHRDYLLGVLPIPTRELGAPKPIPGQPRGLGSNVDWWIATKAPKSVGATGRTLSCVPGLVRTFLVHKSESTWDNEHVAGEDPPLDRKAIEMWEGTHRGR